MLPDLAIIDPEMTITMSPELTAATGMDALCHAFEAYVFKCFLCHDRIFMLSRPTKLLAENLPKVYAAPEKIK
jgi:alcohol dehydrogenase class IV